MSCNYSTDILLRQTYEMCFRVGFHSTAVQSSSWIFDVEVRSRFGAIILLHVLNARDQRYFVHDSCLPSMLPGYRHRRPVDNGRGMVLCAHLYRVVRLVRLGVGREELGKTYLEEQIFAAVIGKGRSSRIIEMNCYFMYVVNLLYCIGSGPAGSVCSTRTCHESSLTFTPRLTTWLLFKLGLA